MKLTDIAALPSPEYRRASDAVEWALQVAVAPKAHILLGRKEDVRDVDGRTEAFISTDGAEPAWQPVPEGAKLLIADEDGRVRLEPEDSDYVIRIVSAKDSGSLVDAKGQPLKSLVALPPIRIGVDELRERHARAIAEKEKP